MSEAGVLGMDISFWQGLWAPKSTPKDVKHDSTPRWRMLSPNRRYSSI
jgi:hypothetical protein